MKDMKITNSFEDLYFFMQISQSCGFGGLGEDQNISLATKRWKIISRWKTPSTDSCISVTFLHHQSVLKQQSKVVKTNNRRASSQRRRNGGKQTNYDFRSMTRNIPITRQ